MVITLAIKLHTRTYVYATRILQIPSPSANTSEAACMARFVCGAGRCNVLFVEAVVVFQVIDLPCGKRLRVNPLVAKGA